MIRPLWNYYTESPTCDRRATVMGRDLVGIDGRIRRSALRTKEAHVSRDNEHKSGHRSWSLLRIAQHTTVAGVLLDVQGEIDLCTGDQLGEALRDAVDQAAASLARVVVDLRGVTFMGAVGLGLLARANEDCGRVGVGVTVVADQRCVLRVLRIAGLDRVLTVVAMPPAGAESTRNGTSGLSHGG